MGLTALCPHCGQPLPEASKDDPEALLRLLRTFGDSERGPIPRDLYRAKDGRWRVTHGGGEWSKRAVLALMARGAIQTVSSEGAETFRPTVRV